LLPYPRPVEGIDAIGAFRDHLWQARCEVELLVGDAALWIGLADAVAALFIDTGLGVHWER
jgi:hypothetical protein